LRGAKKGNRRLRKRVAELKQTIRELQSRVLETEEDTEEDTEEPQPNETDPPVDTEPIADCDSSAEEPEEQEEDYTYAAMEESTTESECDEDAEELFTGDVRVDPSMPEYSQPKFIVFYGMLMNIFTLFCFKCKEAAPPVSMKCHGTMVTVTQHCLKCKDVFEWKSQPLVMGKYPGGNVLLSFAILMAGAPISKVLLIFRHMGVSVYSARTYFRHQRQFIFPTILHYWESYRAKLVDKLKKLKEVVWTGDGRFDSMGHSAKYGAYTMLCTTNVKIVHFEVVQANETGGSQQMELEGCKRSFQFLKRLGLSIPVFISD